MLKELGNAINESISASPEVNQRIQKIRDEGYNLYVVLDATIGLDRDDDAAAPRQLAPPASDAQFRINIGDLGFLRSIGIDPTRKVKALKRADDKSAGTVD